MKVRENKAGLDYRIVNKIMCSLKLFRAYFKGVLTKMQKNNGQGLNPFTKEVIGLGH